MKTLDELDRLAAEKVMGFRLVDDWAWEGEKYLEYQVPGSAERTAYEETAPIWQPTRNIAQAWECLEKFDNWQVERSPAPMEDPYGCTILTKENDVLTFERGATAAEAITLAALAAKGVEID